MKHTLIFFALTIFFHSAMAQQPAPNPFPKTISVSGSSEMEITPDQIYVHIMLREYQKKGESKKDIENIRTQFLQSCQAAGIPDSSISIASFSGSNSYYNWRKKKKDPDMMASIVYQVIFKSSKAMDDLVEKLDDEATQSFQIISTTHSRMPEFRKELKIKAIQAAKNKGIYLTEAINEKLGPAIKIVEPGEPAQVYRTTSSNTYAFNVQARVRAEEPETANSSDMTDFKKLRLRYEVEVLFALQ